MILTAAAAAAFFALSAPLPAQAAMVNPGLNSASPALAQDVQYRYRDERWRHRYRDGRWRHHYASQRHRHRHCWNERVRVRVGYGHFVFRTQRHCGWRGW